MAEKKYNWGILKKEWLAGKYKNIKDLAEKNEIPYSYAKKRVGKWKKEQQLTEKIATTSSKNGRSTTTKKGIKKISPTIDKTSIGADPQQEEVDTFTCVSTLDTPKCTLQIEGDRDERLAILWDKLANIVEIALDDPEQNFFTIDGQLKAKALYDMSAILEKIQKAHDSRDDKEATGQLGEYVKMFDMMKEQQKPEGEGDE